MHAPSQLGGLAEIELLYRTAPIGLCVFDRELRYVRINERLAEINGLPAAAHLGRTVREVVPDLADTAEATLRRILSTGEPVRDVEFVGTTPAQPGVPRTWVEHWLPLKDADGTIVGVHVLAEELTEQRRVQAELARRSRELRQTLDTAAIGLSRLDREFRYVTANAAYASMVGVPLERIVGRSAHEVLGVDALAALQPYIDRVLAGEPLEFELELPGPARDRGWIFARYTPWIEADGTVGGWVASIEDITARKAAEESVRASELKFRQLFDNMSEGCAVHEPIVNERGEAVSYRHVEANPAWERLTGLKREEVLGRDFREIVPGIESIWIDTFAKVAATGEPAHVEQFSAALDNWYSVSVYRPRPGQAATIFSNLTARKRTEEALRRNAETFAALVEQSPLGIFTVGADFRIQHVSAGALPLFGSCQPVVGRDFGEVMKTLWPEPFASEALAIFRHTLATGEPYVSPGLTERRQDSGAVESYEWRTIRVMLADGRYGVVCYFFDVTPLQQALAVAREGELRLRLALEATRGHAFEIDVATGRVRRGPGFEELVGFAAADAPQDLAWWQARIAPEDLAPLEAATAAAIEARSPISVVEYRVRHRDGHYLWVQVHRRFEYDTEGRPVRIVGCTFDIDARKRAEQALEATSARLTEATRAAGMGIHEYYPGPPERLVWDARVRQWWGLSPVEPVTYEKFIAAIHPEDRAAMQAAVDRALDPAGEGRYASEYRVRHPDGTTRWMQATGSVSFEAGRATRLIGSVQDITTLKQLNEELRAADRQKDVFLATLSHELRNPLAPIRTAAQLLGHAKLEPTQLRWAQAVIQRQVQHMARLLDDLLDLSRITQGKLALRRERTDLAAVIDSAIETAQPLLERKNHRLTVSLPPVSPVLDADPLRLAQVVSNLLTNAAKYTDPGGHVELTARVEPGALAIAVSDTGIGIPAEALPRLFEMFSQSGGAHARAEGGLGIGLALLRRLVELHGGVVTARSDGPQRGSTFTVRLPLPSEREAPAPDEAPHARCGRHRRVLVVDDNRDAADALAMLLGADGHEVRVAYDGPAALSLAEAFRPDVALLDIGLPGMDGYALARALRAQPWGGGLRLAALTGWGQEEDRRRALEAGFDRHLTKPVDPRDLGPVLAMDDRQAPA